MRKRIICTLLSAIFALSALPAPALAAEGGVGQVLYENTVELDRGFTLTNTISTSASGKRVESFLLETQPGSPVYPIVTTESSIYEAMTLEDAVAWAEEQGLNVHAAINSDFFYSTLYMPQGCVIENGRYISDINDGNVLAFGPDGAFACRAPEIRMTLRNMGGGEYYDTELGRYVSNYGQTSVVSHLNKVRNNTGGTFMYDSNYHPEATQTYRDGWAVRFRVLSGELTASGQMTLRVEEVVPNGLDIEIGEGFMVFTAPSDSRYPDEYKKFAVGDIVTLDTECSDPRLESALWATGCGDLLAENGELTDEETWDKAIAKNHPRTAVGIKPDGSVIACVIDGRSGSYSNGATLEELAGELLARGCSSVINLDGGGSSAMAVRFPGSEQCAVVNRPSGGYLRKCSTYILFVSDAASDGRAARLGAYNDGLFVLAGSSVPLELLAADEAGRPAPMPEDVTASSGSGTVENQTFTVTVVHEPEDSEEPEEPGGDELPPSADEGAGEGTDGGIYEDDTPPEEPGDTAEPEPPEEQEPPAEPITEEITVTKPVYTAGNAAGIDVVEFVSPSTGAAGHATVHIIDSVDYLNVADAKTGKVPDLTDLSRGDTVTLSVSGSWLSRPVAVSGPAVTFTVSENIGEISPEGVLTVTGIPGSSGEVTVTAGGVTSVLPVKLKKAYADIEGHWAQEYISRLYDRGVLKDTGDMLFRPDDIIERCDLIMILWNVVSAPVFEGECGFTDVTPEDYFYDAVKWAEAIGLTGGVGDGLFNPHGNINREQAFTLLFKLLSIMRKELPAPDAAALEPFEDTGDISGFALDPTSSLVQCGIVAGTGGKIMPLRATSRGEAVTIVYAALFAGRDAQEAESTQE